MNKILIGALAAIGLQAAAGAFVVASGMIDIGADAPHWPVVHSFLGYARERSLARYAAGIEVPADLKDGERIRRGAGNYQAMCVDCHLAPGQDNSEIRRGLYPVPPKLAAAGEGDAARRFRVVKHGIQASGMPAWGLGGMDDPAIWDLVAFLGALPGLSPAAYEELVRRSDGHSHAGMADHDEPAAAPKAHSHAHEAHAHPHQHQH